MQRLREAKPIGPRIYRLTRTIAVVNGRADQLKPRRPSSGRFIRQKDLDRALVVGFMVGAILASLAWIAFYVVVVR